MHSDKCTKGEATISQNTFQGRAVIAVGILGTTKAIAICGFVGAPDEEESKANALRIATDWNRHLEQPPTPAVSVALQTGVDDYDELYEAAVKAVTDSRRASTSIIQRRLRIGYNRAHALMQLMEKRGVVGPENGASPREILI